MRENVQLMEAAVTYLFTDLPARRLPRDLSPEFHVPSVTARLSEFSPSKIMNQTKNKRRELVLCANPFGKNRSLTAMLIAVFAAITFLHTAANSGVAQGVLYTDLQSIRELDPNDAPNALVDFKGTVTYVDGMREFLFVQDGQNAIFVYRPDFSDLTSGQRVRVRGRLAKGDLLPIVSESRVTALGEGELPVPEKVSTIGVEHDCRYLALEFEILQTVVGAEETLLYAKTETNKDVCIQVKHPGGIASPNISRVAGRRVRCTGALGLQVTGGAFVEPGKSQNEIVGYKVFCNSSDDLEAVGKDDFVDANSAQVVGLSLLEQDEFPDGRFQTFAQICLIECSDSPEFVAFDGSNAIRFKLRSANSLQPGMIIRIGGKKTTGQSGPRFDVDYLRHLNLGEFPQTEPVSVQNAVESFTVDRRISVERVPKRNEYREGRPCLILQEGDATVAVHFQDAAVDSLASLEPGIARKVRVTGVSKTDDECDFQLVVVRPDDATLVKKKASLSRMVAIGLAALLAICGLAAFRIRLLKSQIAQKQQFEFIFDNAGCPILVFNGNLQIMDANQLAADMTGYSKSELRNMNVTQIDKHLPEEQIKMGMIRTMQSQTVNVFPTKMISKEQKELDVEVHCRNLSVSEDPGKAKYIAVFPDATARRQYENQLKEARDEAIKANKAKSRFVASMSHELRTPLNGVIGMTQLLEKTELTPTQADYLAACRTSGETLLTVIGDVLDFSKMEADKMELEPQETKLIPFVESIVRATSLQQGTRHVDLASFVDPRLSRSVMVDCDRLRQVLFNLIGNAAKFTAQGSITVTAQCKEVTEQYADVRFVVSDTGIGIPEDRIDRLFEAFEQSDSTTTRQFGGTGLGLTICRQITELMGGQIHAQSVEGQGSDFIVEVQLPFATESATNNEDGNLIVPTGQRVAVVGMSEPISKTLRDMFSAYQVEASFFGEAESLPTGKFDVVLLNTNGERKLVGNYLEQQPAMSSNDAPILIPVVPANCVIKPREWETLGAEKPLFKPFTQTRFVQPVNSRKERGELPGSDMSTKLPKRELRVLICEDNAINQMFAKEVCRRAGIEVVISENGQVGIETLQQDTDFDAIFMDCHMPIMDGFEASRKIRELVNEGSLPKIPVIALTANAVAGDREKCVAAGMDDYLTKPFEIQDFLEIIHTNTTVTPDPATESKANASDDSGEPIFNLEKLLSQIDDRVFALDIANQFAASLPRYKKDLEECLDQQDAELVFAVSHRLKGTASTVKADRISSIATEIESASRDGQLDDLQSQVAELLQEFENFSNVIREEIAIG